MPLFKEAEVKSTGGCHWVLRGEFSSILRIEAEIFSEFGRSALLTTRMSEISISPALRICMLSPASGIKTTSTVSVARVMSNSDCPTPTVSMMIICLPLASRMRETAWVVDASPPITLPALILRKKMSPPSSRGVMRIRSPKNAPPLKGLPGSTATIPTERSLRQNSRANRSTRVLLPTPGAPVTPI